MLTVLNCSDNVYSNSNARAIRGVYKISQLHAGLNRQRYHLCVNW